MKTVAIPPDGLPRHGLVKSVYDSVIQSDLHSPFYQLLLQAQHYWVPRQQAAN